MKDKIQTPKIKNSITKKCFEDLLDAISKNDIKTIKNSGHLINGVDKDKLTTLLNRACTSSSVESLKLILVYCKSVNYVELFRHASLKAVEGNGFKIRKEQGLEKERVGVLMFLISKMNKESKNAAMKFALYLNSKDIVDILFDEKFYKDDFKYLHDNIEENGHPYNIYHC